MLSAVSANAVNAWVLWREVRDEEGTRYRVSRGYPGFEQCNQAAILNAAEDFAFFSDKEKNPDVKNVEIRETNLTVTMQEGWSSWWKFRRGWKVWKIWEEYRIVIRHICLPDTVDPRYRK
jgi:hypothetical protein